ncbi:hypothetical protein [Natrinema thermotolerans]|uniref:hypothetical protein n=1 Tax=Natrinema thermotolerans TaxID=121872 RepID=UPI000679A289|nr:hypothetical protein [Natrinema thermotolerans]QCC57336.1 hypothetical protein DVR14_01255 [Natrinema thermotolerans]
MKRHVQYELEPTDLEAMVEGHPIDLDVENADSVSITTDAYPKIMDSAGGFRFVDEPQQQVVTDGGEGPEATDQDVNENVGVVTTGDLEEIDVTLEESLTREGDQEVVRWTATADGVDVTLGAATNRGDET